MLLDGTNHYVSWDPGDFLLVTFLGWSRDLFTQRLVGKVTNPTFGDKKVTKNHLVYLPTFG